MKEGSSYIKCKYEKSELWCENKGQKIYGVLYKPESQGKMPLVIFAHEDVYKRQIKSRAAKY